jgi:hypothetical protein
MFTYNNKTEQDKTTKTADLQWEIQAYGMTADAVRRMVKQQAFPGTEMMFAAGMLSDAQQLLDPEFNDEGWVSPETANRARQYMNIAKFIMFNQMKETA